VLPGDNYLSGTVTVRDRNGVEKLGTEIVNDAPDPSLVKRTLILLGDDNLVHGNLPIRWHMY
jgi:hypothetical protein